MAKKTKQQIVLVDGDGWEGLYINGRLVTQGHHVTKQDLLEHLGIDSDFRFADTEWLADRGHLPDRLRDVKEA
jgi:hypothetical protein